MDAPGPSYHFDSSFLDPSSPQDLYLVVLNYHLPHDTARLWHKGKAPAGAAGRPVGCAAALAPQHASPWRSA
jgi:hypothetical protein